MSTIKLGGMSDSQPSKDAQETATEDESIAVLSSLGEGWGLYQVRLLILLWAVIEVKHITHPLSNDDYLLVSCGFSFKYDSVILIFFRTISGMVVGIAITSPGLLFAVPKHQCLIPENVTYLRPSNADDQSCYLENVIKFILLQKICQEF